MISLNHVIMNSFVIKVVNQVKELLRLYLRQREIS